MEKKNQSNTESYDEVINEFVRQERRMDFVYK
jgi:hypothetical protein